MRDVVEAALNRADHFGVSYADVRVEDISREVFLLQNGSLRGDGLQFSSGMNVRVLLDGSWGFSATPEQSTEAAAAAAEEAVAVARASASLGGRVVHLAPTDVVQASYETPIEEDPSAVPLEEKVSILLRCDEAMQRDDVAARMARMEFVCRDKLFASTEGSRIDQRIRYAGGGIAAVAAGGGDSQIRSYPHCWQNGGQFRTGGFETIRELNLPAAGQCTAAEAAQLLRSEPCPSGTFNVVVEPSQLALMIHECCGHPVELDRVLGTEESLAGTSFLTPELLNDFQYGSEEVNLTADATLPGGLGTFGYDDEGVPAGTTPLVRNGIFAGYLTSRETAPIVRAPAGGTMRADSWSNLPLIRMTNVNLEPGNAGSLSDILADTSGGLYMDGIRSWSIDDRRLKFQFGSEAAWEISGGRRKKMYRNPTYRGVTPAFWRSCDAVGGEEEWSLWGFPTCGKGHPPQSGQVGHGTAPARFRSVQVGGA